MRAVEEITLEIASLKKSANKAFKKNYKVQKIMEEANSIIEHFFLELINERQEKSKNLMHKSVQLDSLNLQYSYDSINQFIDTLKEYEDNDTSEEALENALTFIRERNETNYSTNDLDNVESKILFAYVSIFCGCLLCMIPTGLTQSAGATLISGGVYVLAENKFTELDEQNKNN